MVYAYYRCSTQTQMEQNGLQMQKDVIAKYVIDNNIEIAEEFSDEAISGTIADRPGITDLLAVLEKGDKVLVQNTSRLWRDDFAKVMIRREIQRAGADVISVEQPKYTVYVSDPNEFLINSMFELLDQYDKLNISMKLAKGRKAKANKGNKACGNAPIGYKWDNAKIIIDTTCEDMIIDIFKQYINLKSLGKLQKYCEEKSYKTSHGKLFSKQSLANILSNDFYIGVVTHAKKKITGNHAAIIDNNLFENVNRILKKSA